MGLAVYPSRSNSESAECISLVSDYNLSRLLTYRQFEGHTARIQIKKIGCATALRFEDVRYFNAIYSPGQVIIDELPEVERFFAGSRFRCSFVGPPMELPEWAATEYRHRKWVPGRSYAWVHAPIGKLRSCGTPHFGIQTPIGDGREDFFRCYLHGFEAEPEVHEPAIQNMRHLFSWPNLHFLLARREGRPVGVGMLLQVGEAALMCAGAVLPGERNRGCHSELVGTRVRLARDLGCRQVFSWALEGSKSERNLLRAGLQRLGVTQEWIFPGTA